MKQFGSNTGQFEWELLINLRSNIGSDCLIRIKQLGDGFRDEKYDMLLNPMRLKYFFPEFGYYCFWHNF